jgi:hypothetical protein
VPGRRLLLPIPGHPHPHTMDEPGTGITPTSGINPRRAGCGGSRTSGSEGGPEKPTHRKTDRALRPDPYTEYPAMRAGSTWR